MLQARGGPCSGSQAARDEALGVECASSNVRGMSQLVLVVIK